MDFFQSVVAAIPITNTAFVDLSNGSDSTGTVGRLDKPFATIGAAEAAITTASSSNIFLIEIYIGSYDVTGLVKKPWINWRGRGSGIQQGVSVSGGTTLTVTSGSLDLAGTAFSIDNGQVLISDMTITCPIVGNFLAIGGSGLIAAYLFTNCQITNTSTITGRGTNDYFYFLTCFLNGEFNNFSSYVNIQACLNSIACNFNFDTISGNQSHIEIFSSRITGIISLSNTGGSLLLAIASASYISAQPVLTGALAFAYFDSNVILPSLSGGALFFRSSFSNMVRYDATTVADWANNPPSDVNSSLDAIVAGIATPPQWLIGNLAVPAANAGLIMDSGHIKSTQTSVPTTATNANAGTGASSSVSNATDSAGVLTLTAGSGAFSPGKQCSVVFDKAYNVAPVVVLTPASSTASRDQVLLQIYVTTSTGGFDINFGIATAIGGTVYNWNYTVIETQ